MRAQNFECDGVEITSDQGARPVTRGSADDGKKRFLRQFFRLGGIRDAAAEKAEDWLFVAFEELGERIGGTL
jgi:hypothetical protein